MCELTRPHLTYDCSPCGRHNLQDHAASTLHREVVKLFQRKLRKYTTVEEWIQSFYPRHSSQCFRLSRKLGETLNGAGLSEKKKNLASTIEIETRFLNRPSCSLATIPTEQSRLVECDTLSSEVT
jgi:hypothetical protein